MTPEQIEATKINARIRAIESLLAATLAASTRSPEARQALISALDRLAENLSQGHPSDPGPDYASDLMTAETQQATENLIAFLKYHLEKGP